MPGPRTYEGGCHCGAVRFRVVARTRDVIRCNCSICTSKGFVHLIVPPDDFELLRGAETLATYTFNTHVAQHRFCKVCGIHPFYTPRSHPDQVDVNVNCLDGDAAAEFTIAPFDGKNWETNVDSIR